MQKQKGSLWRRLGQEQLLLTVLGAGVLLVLFEVWINDLLALPLRIASTAISEVLVSFWGYTVIRQGTSLVVGTFRFNVDTACSGSQTLQMMLVTAIILVGVWGGLRLSQRFLAILLALPLAVLLNGLRVGGLMLVSLRAGRVLPEETVEHQLLGVLAFALLLLIFWQVCRGVERVYWLVWSEPALKLLLVLLLLGIIFFPFAYDLSKSWAGSDWNPYNRYAYIFPLLALLLGLLTRWLFPGSRVSSGRITLVLGYLLAALGLVWAVLAVRLGSLSLQGVGLLLLLSGYLLLALGWRGFVGELPLLLLLMLGFPRVPMLINNLFSVGVAYDWAVLFYGRLFLALVIAGVYILLKMRRRRGKKPGVRKLLPELPGRGGSYLSMLLLLAAGGGLLWQNYLPGDAVAQRPEQGSVLFVPLQVGGWQGREVGLSEQARAFLGEATASLTVYNSDYALPIEFLATFSGGNRHNLHSPEYCLTGNGWKIVSKKRADFTGLHGRKYPITIMELRNDAEIRWFAFWFYDGVKVNADYTTMLGEDLFSRLSGNNREWSLYRVIAYREADLTRFLQELFGELE